jgi:hypothetical protein
VAHEVVTVPDGVIFEIVLFPLAVKMLPELSIARALGLEFAPVAPNSVAVFAAPAVTAPTSIAVIASRAKTNLTFTRRRPPAGLHATTFKK